MPQECGPASHTTCHRRSHPLDADFVGDQSAHSIFGSIPHDRALAEMYANRTSLAVRRSYFDRSKSDTIVWWSRAQSSQVKSSQHRRVGISTGIQLQASN